MDQGGPSSSQGNSSKSKKLSCILYAYYLQARCEELGLQPRGTRGESGGQTGITYDISNKHRLGYSEVELVQKMIDGVNTLWEEDKALVAKQG